MSYVDRAENFGRALRTMSPTLLGVFGVIVWAAPIRLFGGVLPTPLLPLLIVFYWAIYHPKALPALGVFLIGIFQDLLVGAPLGLWSSIYLCVSLIATSQQSYFHGRDQQVIWIGFAVAACLAGFMQWAAMSVVSGGPLPIGRLAIQIFATIALYPFLALVFSEFHRRVVYEA